jgi:hypothetical protein
VKAAGTLAERYLTKSLELVRKGPTGHVYEERVIHTALIGARDNMDVSETDRIASTFSETFGGFSLNHINASKVPA